MNPMASAINWVREHSPEGQGISISSRIRVSYPEVTGYFIPTLCALGEKALARQYAEWLVSVQGAEGGFGLDGQWYAFDTGQVIRGWVSLLPEMPELARPLRRACDWMLQNADPVSGRLPVPAPGGAWSLGGRGEVSEGIHLYTLHPLRQAGELLNEPRYLQFVQRSLQHYLRNVDLVSFTCPNALAHFFAYIQEALVELGCDALARKGMQAVAECQDALGGVPGYRDVSWICSPGLAQYAKVWHLLGEAGRAGAALNFLTRLQNPSGGFFGSYGVGAAYFPGEEVAWTVKYFLDAFQLQITGHFDATVGAYRDDIAETDGRLQAILQAMGDLQGKRVLDAGCGKGRYAAFLKRRFPGADVTALDISAEMLRHVPSGIRTVQESILHMPFSDGQFDAVLCVEALEHVVQVEEGIRELARVLAPGGTLVIIDKNREKLGRLEMPVWERWFAGRELLDPMRACGLTADVKAVGYDDRHQPDGLFLCWEGTKLQAAVARTSQASPVAPSHGRPSAGWALTPAATRR